jgi:hypothetical protein
VIDAGMNQIEDIILGQLLFSDLVCYHAHMKDRWVAEDNYDGSLQNLAVDNFSLNEGDIMNVFGLVIRSNYITGLRLQIKQPPGHPQCAGREEAHSLMILPPTLL